MIFLRLIISIILFITSLYYFVPPIAKYAFDGEQIKASIQTKILPSDQPDILRMDSREKKILRAMHLDKYIGVAFHALIGLPELTYHYLTIKPEHHTIGNDAFGIFVDSSKSSKEDILKDLEELNVSSVAIRVYITKEYINSKAYKDNLELANELHLKNYNILLVLAQLKESFTSDLSTNLNRVVHDFKNSVTYYQIAETVNRSKWGYLSKDQYLEFVNTSIYAIKNDKNAKILGVSVIDFEWYYTIYFNNLAENKFDIMNTLLYVDRVKEPENKQRGFNTEDKIRIFKSIQKDKPLWITEVNWPIKDTGDYKPTSNKEAVTLKEYKNYMIRYLVQAYSSGFIDRVYWWQLHAKGYGLVDHLSKKKRESFYAFKFLIHTLKNATFTTNLSSEIFYEYHFIKNNKKIKIFWSKDGFSKDITLKDYYCFNTSGKKIETFTVTSSPITCKEK